MLITWAGWDTRTDEAKEEIFPVLSRLQQIVDGGRVVVFCIYVSVVPGVRLKPTQPVATFYAWIIWMEATRLTVRPTSSYVDNVPAERYSRLDRGSSTQKNHGF